MCGKLVRCRVIKNKDWVDIIWSTWMDLQYVDSLCIQPKDCSICYDVSATTQLSCMHSDFCTECISKWIMSNKTNPTCPICRSPIKSVQTNDVRYRHPSTPLQEIDQIVWMLACKHTEDPTHRRRFVKTVSRYCNAYPPVQVLRLYYMNEAVIEVAITTYSLRRLVQKYKHHLPYLHELCM